MPIALIIIIIISAITGLLLFVFPNEQSSTEQQPEQTATVDKEVNTVRIQQVEQQTQLPQRPVTDTPPETGTTSATQNTYSNGTYTANASYFTPKRVQHNISVTLTVNNDTITAADVLYDGKEAKTPSHTNFDGAYEQRILGVEIDNLDLARVGGASLTTVAFNEALADIASDASSQ